MQVGSSEKLLDVDALILAVIRRCVSILEVVGLKGDLSSVELVALCKFLFAIADISRVEKESKSAFLSAGEAAYLRMCHELLNKTTFRGSGGETLKPTLTFIIFLTGRPNITGITKKMFVDESIGGPKANTVPAKALATAGALYFVYYFVRIASGEDIDVSGLLGGRGEAELETWSHLKDKSRVFAVTGMGRRHGEGAAAGTPSPPKKPRRERKAIVDSPSARGAVVNGAAQVYLRFKSPVTGELVDRKKQWDRHIKVSLAKETAKACGECEPIADLESWVGRISTFLSNQWFLNHVRPHLEKMREREITYEEAKPHLVAGNYEFYLSI